MSKAQDKLRDEEAKGRKQQAGGAFDEVKGKVKKNVGDALGDKSMKAKGAAQEMAGKARKTAGDARADTGRRRRRHGRLAAPTRWRHVWPRTARAVRGFSCSVERRPTPRLSLRRRALEPRRCGPPTGGGRRRAPPDPLPAPILRPPDCTRGPGPSCMLPAPLFPAPMDLKDVTDGVGDADARLAGVVRDALRDRAGDPAARKPPARRAGGQATAAPPPLGE